MTASSAITTDETLCQWLEERGFQHVVENGAGRNMPPADEYWILEAIAADEPGHLVNQDTATPGRWRVAEGLPGAGEWTDLGTDLLPHEVPAILSGRI